MEIFFTFPNTHMVISAEQVLLSEKISVKVRPIPSSVRAGCGLSLCIDSNFMQKAKIAMRQMTIEFSEIYSVQNGQYCLLEKST